ncbi:sirohydrochlorin cobaltochelatase [Brachyspira catarrhinii]|uniref:Sirohydrochlorin cobaltochelatase n=1 Tax=Brachyspira catarrhinii TaxID=2528966 RepID=A0ABY2TU00_9SPIR|nr:sirohydrochlorin cobaltochelatase [Brachyspira catarrhinii]TKZ35367.1 hypothetical protein EZH24_05665 [Brachyspira catarrhinii]
MGKKSIILLFHGTSNYDDSREMYANIIKKFENEFKDFHITDAYSSSAIRKMILNEEIFPTIESRLKELKNKNIEKIYISPIVILQNKDYSKGFHTTTKFKKDFSVIKYGESSLSTPEDYDNIVSIIKKEFHKNDYTYLFVGHGGKHHSNSAYGMLGYKLYLENESYITMTFAKGIGINEIKNKLIKLNKKILIVPILISKSFHYKNEISKDIVNQIKELGLESEVMDRTFGEWDLFLELCINKTKKLINN